MRFVNSIPDHVHTLIFDLGGVIVDLAPERTLHAFSDLAQKPVEEIVKLYTIHSSFHGYETGKIGEEEFRNAVRKMFNVEADDSEIDRCWNAMLVRIPPEKLSLLSRLKNHFTILALSNTNSIHLSYINEVMLKGEALDSWFHQAHYSHRIGMRKPDREIYQYVLNAHSLRPEQTLFLDDNLDNITAAKALGIEALLIEHPDRVLDLFKNYA